jgi:hypothetical protein
LKYNGTPVVEFDSEVAISNGYHNIISPYPANFRPL